MEQAVEFLKQIVVSLGFDVAGYRIFNTDADGDKAITVGGKDLILPNREGLDNLYKEGAVAFNPLCENTLKGPSEVQEELNDMVHSALNIRMMALIYNLAKVAGSDKANDNKLNTLQAEFLPCLTGYDKEMVKRFASVIRACTADDYKTSLIYLTLKRQGKLGNTAYSRICTVRFPFAEMERKDKPYGVALRIADYDSLRNLLEYILPGWAEDNTYSRGTDSKTAPYFTALITSYYAINSRITAIAKLFQVDFPEFGTLVNEDPWIASMGNLAQMRDSLPSLEGNEGKNAKGTGSTTEVPVIADPQPARSIGVPTLSVDSPELPWNGQGAAPPAAAPAPTRVADDDVVEYVPRAATVPAMHGAIPGVQTGQIPTGYAPVANNAAPTFAQMAQQRVQSQPSYYGTQGPSLPPVGGSPFAATAGTNTGHVPHNPNAHIPYIATTPQPQAPHVIIGQPQGRGF
jgi:hypothetical protein